MIQFFYKLKIIIHKNIEHLWRVDSRHENDEKVYIHIYTYIPWLN